MLLYFPNNSLNLFTDGHYCIFYFCHVYRQYLDFKGFYDRDKMFWKDIQDVVISAACAPPGGGRNPLTPRFVRHFAILLIPSPSEMTLKVIFKVSQVVLFLDNY